MHSDWSESFELNPKTKNDSDSYSDSDSDSQSESPKPNRDESPSPPPITIRRRRRFFPLKNPLNTTPILTEENLKEQCTSFFKKLEENWKEEEIRMEKTIQDYRKQLKNMHKKSKDMYMNLFQWMLNRVYDDDYKQLLEAILLMIEHTDYAEGLAEIMKNAIEFINSGKRPGLVHDGAQYVYGTKPLYFDFDSWDSASSSTSSTSQDTPSI
jgi:hypothetical protein